MDNLRREAVGKVGAALPLLANALAEALLVLFLALEVRALLCHLLKGLSRTEEKVTLRDGDEG